MIDSDLMDDILSGAWPSAEPLPPKIPEPKGEPRCALAEPSPSADARNTP